MEKEDHAGDPLGESGLSGWPSETVTLEFWAVPVGKPGPLGQYWQLMGSERQGMLYEQFEVMGTPVGEGYALEWLIATKEYWEAIGT